MAALYSRMRLFLRTVIRQENNPKGSRKMKIQTKAWAILLSDGRLVRTVGPDTLPYLQPTKEMMKAYSVGGSKIIPVTVTVETVERKKR